MFSALNQGSLVHILDKTDGLKYKVGEVIGVTQPNNYGGVYGTSSFSQPNGNITLKIKVDNDVRDYPDINPTQSVASYNNGNVVISESQAGLQGVVESIYQNSKHIINNIEYYEKCIVDCENIFKQLSPQFAKDKERDDRINALDDKMNRILALLSKDNTDNKDNKPNIKI